MTNKQVLFNLSGQFTVPNGCKPYHAHENAPISGFVLPDGKICRMQIVCEVEDKDENVTEPGTCELQDMGIVGFGEMTTRLEIITV